MFYCVRVRGFGLAMLAACAAMGVAGQEQEPQKLTLEKALMIARQNNGTVRAAYFNYLSAEASTRVTEAAFLPTVTPRLVIDENRLEQHTGLFQGFTRSSTTSAELNANWRLLDSGERRYSQRQAAFSEEQAELSALQTLRETLFSVHSNFYEALRAQELLKVQEDQVKRAEEILKATEFRSDPTIGDLPRKDVSQARADFLNAQVSYQSANNQVANAEASLKAVIGIDQDELPELVEPELGPLTSLDYTLDQALQEGLENRADLEANRQGLRAQEVRVDAARLATRIQYSLDASFTRSFSEDVFDRGGLILQAALPLYDGKSSNEQLKATRFNKESFEASLRQAELNAKAEIESAYKAYSQNLIRIQAANAALEAAQENYRFASDSMRLGAGTLLEVLAAQVTLTTAEVNQVQAQYDLLISEVQLRLATGRPMPGERVE